VAGFSDFIYMSVSPESLFVLRLVFRLLLEFRQLVHGIERRDAVQVEFCDLPDKVRVPRRE